MVEWLSSMYYSEVAHTQVVDREGEWIEKFTPEKVLLAEGLLLKLKLTMFMCSTENFCLVLCLLKSSTLDQDAWTCADALYEIGVA